jgi:hypothetical protein
MTNITAKTITANSTFHRKLIELSSSPAGFAASEVSGHSPEQVRRAAEALAKAGHIVRFNVSARRIRYYATLSLAQDYVCGKGAATPRTQRPGGGPRAKAAWNPDAPMRITARTKIYVAPPLPRNVFRTYTYPQF